MCGVEGEEPQAREASSSISWSERDSPRKERESLDHLTFGSVVRKKRTVEKGRERKGKEGKRLGKKRVCRGKGERKKEGM